MCNRNQTHSPVLESACQIYFPWSHQGSIEVFKSPHDLLEASAPPLQYQHFVKVEFRATSSAYTAPAPGSLVHLPVSLRKAELHLLLAFHTEDTPKRLATLSNQAEISLCTPSVVTLGINKAEAQSCAPCRLCGYSLVLTSPHDH